MFWVVMSYQEGKDGGERTMALRTGYNFSGDAVMHLNNKQSLAFFCACLLCHSIRN